MYICFLKTYQNSTNLAEAYGSSGNIHLVADSCKKLKLNMPINIL